MKTAFLSILSVFLFLIFMIIPGEAMAQSRYSQTLCKAAGYTCFKVPQGESWESLFPDENQRAVLMRINRMNINIHPGMTIAIPENLENMDYMNFAPFDRKVEASGKKMIIVDPQALAFGAYDENGDLVRWGPVAMGKDWCPDIQSGCRTKTGAFAVYREGSDSCASTKYPIPEGGAPMPYCMFFNGGYAIHASTDVPGYHASHGCVRVFYEDAEWLNREFVVKGTAVLVKPYEA